MREQSSALAGAEGIFVGAYVKRLANCQIRFTLYLSALRRAQGVAPSRPIPTPVGPPSAPHRALPHPGVSADTFVVALHVLMTASRGRSTCVQPAADCFG